MAMFNEILVGRWNKALNALFGIKAGAPAPSLAGDLQVSYQLDTAVDGRFLEGWSRWACAVSLLGGAGAVAYLTLLNQSQSKIIAIIEKIKFQLQNDAALQTVQIFKTASLFLGGDVPAVLCAMDLRQTGVPPQNSALLVRTNVTQAGPPAGQFLDVLPIGANAGNFVLDLLFTEHQEVPLLPGESLVMANNTVAKSFQATVWWRERVLEDSELR